MRKITRLHLFKSRRPIALSLALVLVGLAALTLFTVAESKAGEPPKTTKPTDKKADAAASTNGIKSVTIVNKLTGAELYSMHCNRCHPERYPTERTAASWKTVLFHMRVRANLPAEQARTILKYLQDNSGR